MKLIALDVLADEESWRRTLALNFAELEEQIRIGPRIPLGSHGRPGLGFQNINADGTGVFSLNGRAGWGIGADTVVQKALSNDQPAIHDIGPLTSIETGDAGRVSVNETDPLNTEDKTRIDLFSSVTLGAVGLRAYQAGNGVLRDLVLGQDTAGAFVEHIRLTPSGLVFNEGGINLDTRIEGDTDPFLVVVDANADAVGIGVESPMAKLHISSPGTAKAPLRLDAGAAPTSPGSGDSWNDSTQQNFIDFPSGIRQVREGTLYTSTASVTVTTNAIASTLIGSGVGTLTPTENFFVAGKTFRFHAAGVITTDPVAKQLTLVVSLGGTTIFTSGVVAPTNNLTNRQWRMSGTITCRTVGATGTVFGDCLFEYMQAAQGAQHYWEMGNLAAVTVDTTVALAFDLTAQYATPVATDLIKCHVFTLSVMN